MRGVLRCVPKPLCKASTNAAGVVAETTSFPEAGPFAVRERSFPKSTQPRRALPFAVDCKTSNLLPRCRELLTSRGAAGW